MSSRPAPRSAPRAAASRELLFDRVRTLQAEASAENHVGHPRAARRLLRRAQRLLGVDWGSDDWGSDDSGSDHSGSDHSGSDHSGSKEWRELAARLWITTATTQFELAGAESGLEALREAERLITGSDMPGVEVVVNMQRGYLELHAGNLAAAITEFDRADRLNAHADTVTRFAVLMNRGTAHLYLGDVRRARADITRAVAVVEGGSHPAYERMARHNLGCVEYLAGDLARALTSMRQAAEVAPDMLDATSLLDRSRVLLDAGLGREADELLVEAGRLFARERLWKDVAEVELARAECALLGGEIAAARTLAGKARDRFRRRGNDAWRRTAELTLLQADMAAGRPGGKLAPPAKRLVVEFRESGLTTQARTAALIASEALLRTGRSQEARAAADQIPSQRGDPISVRLYDSFVRARLAQHAGDDGAARRHVRNGSNELARYQASFGSIDMQAGSAVHGRRLAELGLEMALADGRPSALLAAVERGRATSSRLIPVESPADEETAALLADLRRTVEVVRVAESGSQSGPQTAQRERIEQLKRLLRARSWLADGSRQTARSASPAAILSGLAERRSGLLCYVQTGEELHLLSSDAAGTLRVRELGPVDTVFELTRRVRADLDVIANAQMPHQLVAAIHRSLRHSLEELDALLVRPARLDDDPVVVIPTGFLAVLPWGSLPSLQGRPVSVAPSGTAWLSAVASRDRSGPVNVEVFSGPGLARSDEEVRAIGRLWSVAKVHVGADAHQDAFVGAISGASIVHVAAHGEHQTENPLFSSMRLADGPVFAYQLDQNARAADHVVLSACELGQATVRPGDEALGLTSVLLHLGTRSVIAGVARVHDDVAAEVMIRYHTALSRGVDSARALADACAAEVDLPTPFVCFGADIAF